MLESIQFQIFIYSISYKLYALVRIPVSTAFNPQNAIDEVSFLHEKPITITMSIVSNNYRGSPWAP